MKQVLKILPVDLDASKCILVCEICNEGFSYVVKDDDKNTYVAIGVFQFEKSRSDDNYSVMLQNELQQQSVLSENFKKVYLIYSVEESVLIPFSLYTSSEADNVLNLIHGDLQSEVSILTDVIDENEIYNCYRITTGIFDLFKSMFPGAVTLHQYSVLIKQVPPEKDKLLIIFYPKKMVLMLNKNGTTRFINTFSYNTTEDVLYILLNTCRQFEADDIPVEISGMIEANSQTAVEIYKYFTSVNFAKLPARSNFSEQITRLPSHYFSYIFEIDACG